MLKNSFSHVMLVQLVFITLDLVYILFNRIQVTLLAKYVIICTARVGVIYYNYIILAWSN